MALKQDFAKQLENQIAVWQAQVGEYQERLGQAGTQGRADYEKAVATMRENVEQANRLLARVREAQEAAWKDMQDASRKAFEQVQKGWADALARFG
jgi:predicted  nucleic acid-binding Zn-ribbon protein